MLGSGTELAGTAALSGVARTAADLFQAGGDSPALLEYFTFIPQALVVLFAVGLRRYVLDDESVPWWLDRVGLRRRASAAVPSPSIPLSVPSKTSDGGRTSDASGADDSEPNGTDPASSGSGSVGTTAAGSSAGTENTATVGSATGTSGSGGSGRRGRASAPDRLALSYRDQRIVVGDGDTVDEEVRGMLRAAGEAEHTKWIDDRHLSFVRDEHGFTVVAHGENLTRLNGDRLRAGERARVGPGDEIELSGVVTLAVATA